MSAGTGKGRLSMAAEIRELIAAAPDGLTCAQVQAAFPDKNVGVALGTMSRKSNGMLTRTGTPRRYVYRLAREVQPRTMGLSREEMRARRQELARQRYQDMSPEAYAAYLAAKREANQAKRAEKNPSAPRRARVPAAKAPARATRAMKVAPKTAAGPRAMVIAPPSAESYTARRIVATPPAETVAEWMARTGQKPEQLSGFQGVQPYTRQPIRSF